MSKKYEANHYLEMFADNGCSLVVCCCKAVSDGSHFALQEMSHAVKRSVFSTYFNVPEPLIASDAVAMTMYPWRAFVSKYVCRTGDDSRRISKITVRFIIIIIIIIIKQENNEWHIVKD